MIICLSGFVIAGTSPTSIPISSRNDITVSDRLSAACAPPARYSPHHQQLVHQLAPSYHYPGVAPPLPPHAIVLHNTSVGSNSSSAESVSSHSASPPISRLRFNRVRTLYACLGESEGELSFEPNQIITNVAPSAEPGWLRGTLNGRTGLVPENYVEPLP